MICTFAWVLTEVALGQKKDPSAAGRSVFTLKILGVRLGKDRARREIGSKMTPGQRQMVIESTPEN
jgi:hypothetical protein